MGLILLLLRCYHHIPKTGRNYALHLTPHQPYSYVIIGIRHHLTEPVIYLLPTSPSISTSAVYSYLIWTKPDGFHRKEN